MIEFVNENRHISVSVIPLSDSNIVLRARLKGVSFDDRQSAIKVVYNDNIVRGNSFHFRCERRMNTLEVMAIKNGISKSIGFIPEEIVSVLRKHKSPMPEVVNVEIRKHVGDSVEGRFGVTARIKPQHELQSIEQFMKDIEESFSKESANGREQNRTDGNVPDRQGEHGSVVDAVHVS